MLLALHAWAPPAAAAGLSTSSGSSRALSSDPTPAYELPAGVDTSPPPVNAVEWRAEPAALAVGLAVAPGAFLAALAGRADAARVACDQLRPLLGPSFAWTVTGVAEGCTAGPCAPGLPRDATEVALAVDPARFEDARARLLGRQLLGVAVVYARCASAACRTEPPAKAGMPLVTQLAICAAAGVGIGLFSALLVAYHRRQLRLAMERAMASRGRPPPPLARAVAQGLVRPPRVAGFGRPSLGQVAAEEPPAPSKPPATVVRGPDGGAMLALRSPSRGAAGSPARPPV